VSRGWLERLNEREKAGKYRFDPYNGAFSQFDRSDGTIVLQEPLNIIFGFPGVNFFLLPEASTR
jgi:hypothetical protein